MLPFTVRRELCSPNAATRTEPALTVTLPVTTAGPAGTAHSPFTTTLELTVPTSTPGDASEPLQVTVPVTAAPAAVTGPAASTPPTIVPVNTRQDKPRRYPLMAVLLPFRPGYLADWPGNSNRARRPSASPAAEGGLSWRVVRAVPDSATGACLTRQPWRGLVKTDGQQTPVAAESPHGHPHPVPVHRHHRPGPAGRVLAGCAGLAPHVRGGRPDRPGAAGGQPRRRGGTGPAVPAGPREQGGQEPAAPRPAPGRPGRHGRPAGRPRRAPRRRGPGHRGELGRAGRPGRQRVLRAAGAEAGGPDVRGRAGPAGARRCRAGLTFSARTAQREGQ